MASVFTLIINGDLPARFVWEDDECVAFLSINPMAPGHVLVVPRHEMPHWIDLDPDLLKHVMGVCQIIGIALEGGFQPEKVGLMIAGLEVEHAHLHLVPIRGVHDLDFANADPDPDPSDLDAAAATIRIQLREMGRPEVVD
jgi:histidine triad (HIT) family protein